MVLVILRKGLSRGFSHIRMQHGLLCHVTIVAVLSKNCNCFPVLAAFCSLMMLPL